MGGQKSIFDDIAEDDLIFAFFPCTRFEDQILLAFRGQLNQFKKWDMAKKIKYDMNLMNELHMNYMLVCKMFLVCLERKIKLIMENPYSEQHFLRRYWCYPPSIIDKDRREDGDYFAKPTQYWFVNFEPKQNLLWEPTQYNHFAIADAIKKINKSVYGDSFGAVTVKVARSMIHPDYANRFIRKYIIDEEKAVI